MDVNEDTVTWKISVNIDKEETNGYYTPFVLEDILPQGTFGSVGYIDDFVSVDVTGLEGTEHAETSFKYAYKKTENGVETYTNDAYGKTGDYKKPSSVVLTFYRSEGTSEPGINASSDRTLTVTLVTRNNKNWLNDAAEKPTDGTLPYHTNNAKINEWNTVHDTVRPMTKTVHKGRNGSSEAVTGSDGNVNAWKNIEYDSSIRNYKNTNNDYNTNRTDIQGYEFWVAVGGVTSANLEDGKLILEDSFDSRFRVVLDDEDGKGPKIGAGDSYNSFNALSLDASKGQTFTWTQTEDGHATFILTNPPKNGDNYYPYYMVTYRLVPKSDEDITSIKMDALEAGGKATFTNTATSGGASDDLDFTFDYKVIDKSSVQDTAGSVDLEKYTIKINPDKLTLNNGETMTMTDTYSGNLSVDFGTITVTAVGKNGEDRSSEVTWDYRKNKGTFTIPDETFVTISYNARVVGDAGSVQTISNTAYMEGYSDTVTNDRYISASGDGSAEKIRVRLLKFAADHMEGGLSGAQFRLLDQDKNPVLDSSGNEVIYTTGIGYVDKYGVIHAASDTVEYTVDNSSGTYSSMANYNDLTDDAKQKANNNQIKFSINIDTESTDLLPT